MEVNETLVKIYKKFRYAIYWVMVSVCVGLALLFKLLKNMSGPVFGRDGRQELNIFYEEYTSHAMREVGNIFFILAIAISIAMILAWNDYKGRTTRGHLVYTVLLFAIDAILILHTAIMLMVFKRLPYVNSYLFALVVLIALVAMCQIDYYKKNKEVLWDHKSFKPVIIIGAVGIVAVMLCTVPCIKNAREDMQSNYNIFVGKEKQRSEKALYINSFDWRTNDPLDDLPINIWFVKEFNDVYVIYNENKIIEGYENLMSGQGSWYELQRFCDDYENACSMYSFDGEKYGYIPSFQCETMGHVYTSLVCKEIEFETGYSYELADESTCTKACITVAKYMKRGKNPYVINDDVRIIFPNPPAVGQEAEFELSGGDQRYGAAVREWSEVTSIEQNYGSAMKKAEEETSFQFEDNKVYCATIEVTPDLEYMFSATTNNVVVEGADILHMEIENLESNRNGYKIYVWIGFGDYEKE